MLEVLSTAAQSSAQAAGEIRRLISNSNAQITQGVEGMQDASSHHRRCGAGGGSCESSDACHGRCYDATELQALVKSNAALNDLDRVTQENARQAEESAEAAQGMSSNAAVLGRTLEVFRM